MFSIDVLVRTIGFYVLVIGTSTSLGTVAALAQAGQSGKSAIAGSPPEPQAAVRSIPSTVEQPAITSVDPDEQKTKETPAERQTPAIDQAAAVSGTVTNANGDMVPGATITLEGPHDRRTAIANESGAFHFDGLRPGDPYRLIIEARDLESWKSNPITLEPGQYSFLKDIKLKIPDLVTSVTVYANREQIAAQQVELATKQRILGFIPNFYVTYDPEPVPLTAKLKFKLAYKADTNLMTFVGIGFMSAIYQAGDMPDYGQGWDAYAKRMGAGYADTTTDIFLGGAIYPSIFRQDPRYFYQGTGTVKSRALHAMASPYLCKGDNGKTQPNYSSLLGDLTSGAISNSYYPESNRGAGLLFEGFAITTAVRTVNGLLQEFLIRKLTPRTRARY